VASPAKTVLFTNSLLVVIVDKNFIVNILFQFLNF
jgi:hypothetical protein